MLASHARPSDPRHRATRGIAFDVTARSSHDVCVQSLRLAGDLGKVRVFVLDGEVTCTSATPGSSSSSTREIEAKQAARHRDWRLWTPVAELELPPHWASHAEVPLRVGVIIKAGTTRRFYVNVPPPSAASVHEELTEQQTIGARPISTKELDAALDKRKAAAKWACSLLYLPQQRRRRFPLFHRQSVPPQQEVGNALAEITSCRADDYKAMEWRSMSMLPPFVSPEFTRKDVERPIPPTEYGLLVGGIRCTRATASASEDGGSDDAERVDVPPADECSQIISLESVQPDIGCVNRQLIAERHGVPCRL